MHLSSFAFVLLGVPMSLVIPFTEIPQKLMTQPEAWTAFYALLALALVSTVLALVIFYKLVQETSAVFGATVAYIIPIVALFWGIMDGEFIGWMHIASMMVILYGVYLIRRGQVNNPDKTSGPESDKTPNYDLDNSTTIALPRAKEVLR